MNKKGAVELSVNFLVILIITLVIFGFGVNFLYRIFYGANKLRDMNLEELDRKIESLLCEGNQRVCIGTTSKTIYRKKFDVFTIKIVNFENEQDFRITIPIIKHIDAGSQNPPITLPGNTQQIRLLFPETAQKISRNGEKSFPIGVEVDKSAPSGTYIIDIGIQRQTSSGFSPYGNLQKIYVNVP